MRKAIFWFLLVTCLMFGACDPAFATVSTTTTRVTYTGNSSTTVFPYTFEILDDDDIVVVLRTIATGAETTLTKTTHYSVSGVGTVTGGNVTTVATYSSSYQLIIYRNTAKTQETDYVENDPFQAETSEQAFDKLTLIVQDMDEELGRSIRVTPGSSLSGTALEITPVASKGIGFNSGATGLTTFDPLTTDGVNDTHIDWGTGANQVSADDVPDGATNIIPTATQETNWDTAYGWGDHSTAGYLTAVPNTAVTPGTYGDATHVPQIVVGADGRLTSAADVAISGAYQTADAELTALAGLTSAADKLPYFTGSATADVTGLTAFGRSIIDDADEATFKATVNLEIGTDVQAYDADLSTYASITPSADVQTLLGQASTATIQAQLSVDNLITLTGVAEGAENLGLFTSPSVSDSKTIKATLEDLGATIDGLPGGHSAVTLDADAAVFLDLSTQEIGLDVQTANTVLAGPDTGAANEPTFRALVAADIPDISATYATAAHNHSGVYEPTDADLTAIAALTDTGIVRHTAANTWTAGTGISSAEITNGAVALADMADLAANTIIGRVTASTGVPEALTAANVRTIINVADGANAYVHPNHTGDVTSVADGAATIAADAVTNAKMANMAANSVKVNATASDENPTDLELAANKFIARASSGNLEAKTITDQAIILLDDTDAAGMRMTLGLTIGTNVQAYDADLTTYAGITPSADVQTFLGYANLAAIKAGLSVDDLVTLSGVADGAVNLGTFTGTTITDSQTIKAALQEVETAIEGIAGGHDPVTLDADAAVILDLSTQEIGLDTQAPNYVLAGPATGTAPGDNNEPTFRALAAADIPTLAFSKITTGTSTGTLAVGTGGSLAASGSGTIEATNISAGSAGQILYQSASGTTAKLAVPSSGTQILTNTSGGSLAYTYSPTMGSPTLTGSLIFEGSTDDAYETTIAVEDPTAYDKTFTIPNYSGVPLISVLGGNKPGVANGVSADANQIIFEGATANDYETILQASDPTGADRTITLPDATGTVITTGNTTSVGTTTWGSGTDFTWTFAGDAGTDPTIGVDTNTFNIETNAATGLVNIKTGNLKVGNGTPTNTQNGEDAYIEGVLEVDGYSYLGALGYVQGTTQGRWEVTTSADEGYSWMALSNYYGNANQQTYLFGVTGEVGAGDDLWIYDESDSRHIFISEGSVGDVQLYYGGLKKLATSATGALIGSAEAATDYALTFDGETSDGTITWMEDEGYAKGNFNEFNADTYSGTDTEKIQAAVNAALAVSGGTVYIPARTWTIEQAGAVGSQGYGIYINATGTAITIRGDGYRTILNTTDDDTAVFYFATQKAPTVKDLMITFDYAGATAPNVDYSWGIIFKPYTTPQYCEHPMVDHVLIYKTANGIKFDTCGHPKVTHSSIWVYNGGSGYSTRKGISLVADATPSYRDGGDGIITSTHVYGQGSGYGYGIYQEGSGGLKIVNCKLQSFNYGYYGDFPSDYATSLLQISNGSMEGNRTRAIYIESETTNRFSNIEISNLQLAQGIKLVNVAWATLTGNVIGPNTDVSPAAPAVELVNTDNITITGNTIRGGAGVTYGISSDSNCTVISVGINAFESLTTANYFDGTFSFVNRMPNALTVEGIIVAEYASATIEAKALAGSGTNAVVSADGDTGGYAGFYAQIANTSYTSLVTSSAASYLGYTGNLNFRKQSDGSVLATLSNTGDFTAVGDITSSGGACCADYVFEPAYALPTLEEVEGHYTAYKHLPGMTTTNPKDGAVNLSQRAHELLIKVEEQALYISQLHKRLKKLEDSLK